MAVDKFEDLVAWQKARELTRGVYEVTRRGAFKQDQALMKQLQRASVSVMSNLTEGFERGGRKEFHHFTVIAKGSCAEVRCQLYVAYDAGYITLEEFSKLMEMAKETTRVIAGLRKSLEPKTPPQPPH